MTDTTNPAPIEAAPAPAPAASPEPITPAAPVAAAPEPAVVAPVPDQAPTPPAVVIAERIVPGATEYVLPEGLPIEMAEFAHTNDMTQGHCNISEVCYPLETSRCKHRCYPKDRLE